ncbi:MAG: urease accessory protein UreE [Synechococcaceae cyanobacterium]
MADAVESLVLVGRGAGPPPTQSPVLALPLTAEERNRLRGLRHSSCGRALLLQLPRGEPLAPGEWLHADPSGPGPLPWVRVEAAPEPLLLVRAATPLALLQAAYHLGNRHVALELRENELRLGDDPVLADLLMRRRLRLERRHEPFLPEAGAYAGTGHGHGPHHGVGPSSGDRQRHGPEPTHSHSHSHSHEPAVGPSPSHEPAHGEGLAEGCGPRPEAGPGAGDGLNPGQSTAARSIPGPDPRPRPDRSQRGERPEPRGDRPDPPGGQR